MKKQHRKWFWLIVLSVFVLLIASCGFQREIWIVRVSFDELKEGAFYGGSLVYHPSDPSRSHLAKGTLISFQDITYGWEDAGDEEFVPVVQGKRYGYLYIQQVDSTQIVYEYLLYGPNGEIIEKENNLSLGLLAGEPDFSQARSTEAFRGFVYHSNQSNAHQFLQQTQLLTFIHELPKEADEGEQSLHGREILPQEQFRRMVFRIENAGNTPLHSQKGVLGASIEHPRALVMNSAYYTVVEFEGQDLAEQIALLRTAQLPEFCIGDYIIDAHYDGVREIVEILDNPDLEYLILQTQKAHLEDALGTVVVEIEGDLGQIIQRYGSPLDKQRLTDAEKRYRTNLLDKSWELELFKQHGIEVTLTNSFSLDINVSLNFHLSWKEVSSNGSITFPMEFSSILALDALLGFKKSNDYRLGDPGISFTVSGVPVRISVPIDFYFSLEAVLAELEMEFGPVLNLELGFRYNIGAKIRFKWKVIPTGVDTWANASGIHSESAHIQKSIRLEGTPHLTSKIGLRVSPGVTIASVIRPQMEIPFELQGALYYNPFKKKMSLGLNFITHGDIQIKVDVKFYNHTFNLGRAFEYGKILYQHEW